MKIQFEKNQTYQLQAIQAVVDTLEGQHLNAVEFSLAQEAGSLAFTEYGVGNQLTISEEQLLENLQKVQAEHSLEKSPGLAHISNKGDEEAVSTTFCNFSVDGVVRFSGTV